MVEKLAKLNLRQEIGITQFFQVTKSTSEKAKEGDVAFPIVGMDRNNSIFIDFKFNLRKVYNI